MLESTELIWEPQQNDAESVVSIVNCPVAISRILRGYLKIRRIGTDLTRLTGKLREILF